MSATPAEFYQIRHQLLLINPYEMIFWLSAPGVVLWSIIRRRSLRFHLLLGAIYVVVLYPTLITAMSLHWDLIARWQASPGPRPAVLEDMLRGDGPKMIMLVVVGWGYVIVKYVFWLLLFSPAVYLLDRRRRRSQPPASGTLSSDGRPVLSGAQAVASAVSDVFLVLGIIAIPAAGPCYWLSLQSDAPPPARSMLPMFFVVGAFSLAIGAVAQGVSRVATRVLRVSMAKGGRCVAGQQPPGW